MNKANTKKGEIRQGSLKEDGIIAYECEVMHQRLRPFTYVFRYQIMSVCLDVDAFVSRITPFNWLGFNRFGLMSIHTKDFGSRDGQNWRDWLTQLLKEYGLNTPPKRIVLACMPRCLGYGFNPLAMWYAYDHKDSLIAVVAEVSNTFGHFHHYVLAQKGEPIEVVEGRTLRVKADKVFHVSPFMSMSCRYHFAIAPPSLEAHKPYSIHIRETEDEQNTLIATQKGKPIALPPNRFGLVRLGYWLSSFKTIAAIHWWALKIVFKGGRFRSTPKHQQKHNHQHSPLILE